MFSFMLAFWFHAAMLAIAPTVFAASIPFTTKPGVPTYSLVDDYTANPVKFFESFTFFDLPDPTNGFVDFLNSSAAAQAGLIGYSLPDNVESLATALLPGKPPVPVVFKSDSKTVLSKTNGLAYTPPSAGTNSGRSSVRLTSTKSYQSGILLLADIAHMPTGCGTWPALWMVGPNWPQDGEIDIIEGVHGLGSNTMTLHTSSGCMADNSSASNAFTGTLATDNCDVNAQGQNKNSGCGILAPASSSKKQLPATFGDAFNRQGGGTFAMQWTDDAISIWFFEHGSTLINSVNGSSHSSRSATGDGGDTVDISTFGVPLARWSSSSCAISQRFQSLSIVVDTTFCGDWAGNTWKSSGCAAKTGFSTCQAFVAEKPEEFEQAYWEIRSLKVYE